MKKKAFKMRLSRETLGALDRIRLADVVGATAGESNCPSNCIGCYPTIWTECISGCIVCPQETGGQNSACSC